MNKNLIIPIIFIFIILFPIRSYAYITSLSLNSPVDLAQTVNTTPDFTFTPISNVSASFSCTLYIDNSPYGTNSSTQNNTQTTITANSSITYGDHTWYINCTDTDGTVKSSERTIGIGQNFSRCAVLIDENASYYLNGSILNTYSSKCIDIQANNITLDCQGNTIDGVSAYQTYGIYSDRNYTQIRKCVVKEWYRGITFNQSSYGIIYNNTLRYANSQGILLYFSSENLVTNNTVSNSRHGIQLNSGNNNNITYSNSSSNSGCGIYVYKSNYSYIEYNNVSRNNDGICIFSSFNNSIIQNIFSSNRGGNNNIFSNVDANKDGVYIDSSSYNNLSFNKIILNYRYGIYVSSSSNNYFYNNIIKWNDYDGILSKSSTDTYRNNMVFLRNSLAINLSTDCIGSASKVPFNFSIDFPNDIFGAINSFSLHSTPEYSISYDNTTNNIFGDIIPTKQGAYSLNLEITDTKNNSINYVQEMFYAKNITKFTSRLKYYLRPGVNPIHGQPAGSDRRAILFSKPTSLESFHCTAWVQASVDDVPNYTSGFIRNVSMFYWYSVSSPATVGIERLVTYSTHVDIQKNIPSSSTGYSFESTNFTNINWEMFDDKSWYDISFKLSGVSPYWVSGPNNLSYILIDYIRYVPIRKYTHDLFLISSTLSDDMKSAEIILDGDGTHDIQIEMPVEENYTVLFDKIPCNTTSFCSYTINGTDINITATFGSVHTIVIRPITQGVESESDYQPVFTGSVIYECFDNDSSTCAENQICQNQKCINITCENGYISNHTCIPYEEEKNQTITPQPQPKPQQNQTQPTKPEETPQTPNLLLPILAIVALGIGAALFFSKKPKILKVKKRRK